MDEKQAAELATYLQSKEFRREVRPLVWTAAAWSATGAWGGLAMLGGFKLWDVAAKDARRHLDALNDPQTMQSAGRQVMARLIYLKAWWKAWYARNSK